MLFRSNDNWPVASWSSLEYSGRWKVLHYMARRFYSPVKTVIYRTSKESPLELYFISDLPCKLAVNITVTLRRLSDGKAVKSWPFSIKIEDATSRKLEMPDLYTDAKARAELPVNECFLTLETTAKGTSETYHHEDVFCLDVWKHCDLPDTKISLVDVAKYKDGAFDVVIESNAPAFYVWLAVDDDPTGRFSDNAFSMLPGKKHLTYRPGVKMTPAAFRNALSICDLCNSYH